MSTVDINNVTGQGTPPNDHESVNPVKAVKASHFTRKIQILMSNKLIRSICDNLFNDVTFKTRVKDNIELIMEDGKIDYNDIHPIVLLVLDIVSELKDVKREIHSDDFSDLIKCIVYHILEYYVLTEKNSQMLVAEFCSMVDKHLDIALRLALNTVVLEIHRKGLWAYMKSLICCV